MRFIQDKDGWFIDSLGKKRFHVTELVQPSHPLIRKLANGKTVEQIAAYWRDEYSYNNNPPFRLLLSGDTYALDAPDDFTPCSLVEHIFRTKKADCFGGSNFVASLLQSQGYEVNVCLGWVVSTQNNQNKQGHAWLEVYLANKINEKRRLHARKGRSSTGQDSPQPGG